MCHIKKALLVIKASFKSSINSSEKKEYSLKEIPFIKEDRLLY